MPVGDFVTCQASPPSVQVVYWAALQETDSKAADLVRSAVVDLELLAAATDVDTALAQRHAMAINPLVCIADDEEIVLPRRDNGPHQSEGLCTQVLRFIHNHRTVWEL